MCVCVRGDLCMCEGRVRVGARGRERRGGEEMGGEGITYAEL